MNAEPAMAAPELVLTRTFDAPRALVFKVWTDAKHLAAWWGPRGFTNPVCEIDPRPGGAIRIHMQGFGNIYPMTGTYVEVVEPERIVFTSAALNDAGAPFLEMLTTVTLSESDGKTTLTLVTRVVKALPEAAEARSGMEEGWNQSLDRLVTYVTSLQ